MPENTWQPGATYAVMQRRATMLQAIRRFFEQRSVLEVDTPALSRSGNTDPNIESLTTHVDGRNRPYFLHTSPEFAMKRILAAHKCDIYQVCKVFRQGESGRRHNPEFTMLEWYRVGIDHIALMAEVELLITTIAPELDLQDSQRVTYADAIMRYAGVSIQDSEDALLEKLQQRLPNRSLPEFEDKDAILDWLMAVEVAPNFPTNCLTFVFDYPVSQASLAKIRSDNDRAVAERFEVYLGETELANGFHELTDAREQRERFEGEQNKRAHKGSSIPPIDNNLLKALEHGMPECAGVAMGLDRLLMATLKLDDIADVLAFTNENA